MSSTAGMKMKAAGSGLKEEGKFRQRVDNHYKMMAAARSRLGTAGRLQLAAALGVGSVASVGAVADDDAAPFLPVWLIALFALYIAVVGRLGSGCAEAKDPKLVEKRRRRTQGLPRRHDRALVDGRRRPWRSRRCPEPASRCPRRRARW